MKEEYLALLEDPVQFAEFLLNTSEFQQMEWKLFKPDQLLLILESIRVIQSDSEDIEFIKNNKEKMINLIKFCIFTEESNLIRESILVYTLCYSLIKDNSISTILIYQIIPDYFDKSQKSIKLSKGILIAINKFMSVFLSQEKESRILESYIKYIENNYATLTQLRYINTPLELYFTLLKSNKFTSKTVKLILINILKNTEDSKLIKKILQKLEEYIDTSSLIQFLKIKGIEFKDTQLILNSKQLSDVFLAVLEYYSSTVPGDRLNISEQMDIKVTSDLIIQGLINIDNFDVIINKLKIINQEYLQKLITEMSEKDIILDSMIEEDVAEYQLQPSGNLIEKREIILNLIEKYRSSSAVFSNGRKRRKVENNRVYYSLVIVRLLRFIEEPMELISDEYELILRFLWELFYHNDTSIDIFALLKDDIFIKNTNWNKLVLYKPQLNEDEIGQLFELIPSSELLSPIEKLKIDYLVDIFEELLYLRVKARKLLLEKVVSLINTPGEQAAYLRDKLLALVRRMNDYLLERVINSISSETHEDLYLTLLEKRAELIGVYLEKKIEIDVKKLYKYQINENILDYLEIFPSDFYDSIMTIVNRLICPHEEEDIIKSFSSIKISPKMKKYLQKMEFIDKGVEFIDINTKSEVVNDDLNVHIYLLLAGNYEKMEDIFTRLLNENNRVLIIKIIKYTLNSLNITEFLSKIQNFENIKTASEVIKMVIYHPLLEDLFTLNVLLESIKSILETPTFLIMHLFRVLISKYKLSRDDLRLLLIPIQLKKFSLGLRILSRQQKVKDEEQKKAVALVKGWIQCIQETEYYEAVRRFRNPTMVLDIMSEEFKRGYYEKYGRK